MNTAGMMRKEVWKTQILRSRVGKREREREGERKGG